jgi:phosphoglycerate-specific signal transduction histidine kinase
MKIIICMIAVTLLAASCSTQRKVQKAIHTVTYNDTAFDHVGKLWERFHPCVNDTVSRIDTVDNPIFIDADINIDSLKKTLDTAKGSTIVIHVPCPPAKVVVKYIRDTRHEQLVRDSLDVERARRIRAESQLAGTGQTIADLRKNLTDQTKSFGGQLTKRTLVILIPAILIIALLLYALFKRRTIPI